MGIAASQLIALVEARGAKEAAGQLLEVGAASDTAGEKIKSMATTGLLVAGAAAVGFGVASVKMAGDFEQSTNLLITSAGEVPKNIDLIRKGLLQMSVDTATPTSELVKGMFNIESSGYRGAQALLVEKAAAEGARVENADLAATTDVLTTAMHNYHEPASQAVDVMNSFRMSASMGKMHMDDLTGALRNVLPIASQAGVSLTGVEAALSTMSLAGDKGTSAGTHLSQMLTYLLAPSKKATSALTEVGLTTQKISDEMKVSLPGTVEMITDAVGKKFPVGSAKYIAALSAIVGGNKSMKAMLELSGISLKTFTEDASQLAPTMKANSTAVDGWTTVQGNFNFKMEAAKNAVEALMISVGTKLLPVVSQLADMVTPLIQDFSKWVGSLDQVGAAFQSATEPIKKTQEALAPLTDTFDRATAILGKTNTTAKPLLDTFDRATAILHQTHQAAAPLLDTFDRATAIIPKTTEAVKKTTEAINPLVAIFKYWQPVLTDTVTTIEKLAGDVETFAVGIFDAADKSGAFQSALQFIHDILPDVDTFLTGAGAAIDSNLLPPLESLITNVGYVARDFTDWLDKSGTAKSAIADLGTAVSITAQSVGTLVGWLADIVGWFDQDAPQAYVLAGAVTAVGLAFAGLKLANTVAGFQQMFSKLADGEGIVTNLASKFKDGLGKAFDDFTTKQFPNLKKGMDEVADSADKAAVAETKVAATPANRSRAWFTDLEGDLGGVEEQANAATVAEETVGTTAETKMASGVEAGAAESAASLDEITASAEGATVAEETVGSTAETKMAGGVEAGASSSGSAMGGLGGIIGGLIIGIGVLGNQLAWSATKGKDFVSQFQQGDWLGMIEHFIALGTPGGQLASTIDTFTKIGQKMGLVKDDAQDMDKKTSAAAAEMQKNVVASGNDMANKMVASLELMRGHGVTSATKFSDSVMAVFNEMKTSGIQSLSDLDDSAKSYLQEIQDYVNAMNGNLHLAQDNINARKNPTKSTMVGKNAYASGTDYAPGGMSLVGERGAELVLGPTFGNLEQGSRVIPHAQTEALLGGLGGGGGNSQPIHVHVHIADHEFEYLTNAMMQKAMTMANLTHGRRVF